MSEYTLTTSLELFKAFISHLSGCGHKLVMLVFKPGRMQRGASISAHPSEGSYSQLEIAPRHQLILAPWEGLECQHCFGAAQLHCRMMLGKFLIWGKEILL